MKNTLCIDVGGTKTALSILALEANSLFFQKEKKYLNKEFTRLENIIIDYLDKLDIFNFQRIVIACAGLVSDQKSELTNLGWEISSENINALIYKHFNRDFPVILINDLLASSYSIKHLSDNDFIQISGPKPTRKGNYALMSVGTGLGESFVFYSKGEYHHLASEGGHCAFSPTYPETIDLFSLSEDFHASNQILTMETFLSGYGLVRIYEKLSGNPTDLEPRDIHEMTMRGNLLAKKTFDAFTQLLAVETMNICLKFLPYEGVFITGGVIGKVQNLLDRDKFLKIFFSNKKMEALLERIPIYFLKNEKTPLIGAFYYKNS